MKAGQDCHHVFRAEIVRAVNNHSRRSVKAMTDERKAESTDLPPEKTTPQTKSTTMPEIDPLNLSLEFMKRPGPDLSCEFRDNGKRWLRNE